MRLQNKIGVVTAAGFGMGRAGTLRFAREGAAVAVADLNGDAANAALSLISDEASFVNGVALAVDRGATA